MNLIEIQVGQVWEDNDPRQRGRYLVVEAVTAQHIDCHVLKNGKKTRIARDRFKPTSTGYRLVLQPELAGFFSQFAAYALAKQKAIQRT